MYQTMMILFISLIITAIAYLMIPIILYFALHTELRKPIMLTIVITNAVVVFSAFVLIRYWGSEELSPGNLPAAIIWSSVGYIILKKKNSKLFSQDSETITDSQITNIPMSANPNKLKSFINSISSAIIAFGGIIFILLSSKISIYIIRAFYSDYRDWSNEIAMLNITQISNSIIICGILLFIFSLASLIFSHKGFKSFEISAIVMFCLIISITGFTIYNVHLDKMESLQIANEKIESEKNTASEENLLFEKSEKSLEILNKYDPDLFLLSDLGARRAQWKGFIDSEGNLTNKSLDYLKSKGVDTNDLEQ